MVFCPAKWDWDFGTEGGDLGIKAKVNIFENADGAEAAWPIKAYKPLEQWSKANPIWCSKDCFGGC